MLQPWCLFPCCSFPAPLRIINNSPLQTVFSRLPLPLASSQVQPMASTRYYIRGKRKEETVLIVTLPVFIDTVPVRTASHPCWTSFISLAPPPIISVPSRSQSLMVVVCRYVVSNSCDPMDCSPPISLNSISSPFPHSLKVMVTCCICSFLSCLLFDILAFPIFL